jgi:transposase
MTDYREILRQHSLGISQRSIALALKVSRNTVSKVLTLARDYQLQWPLDANMTNDNIELLFKEEPSQETKVHPDWEWIHKEYLKAHVTLKLLWMEYCDKARAAQENPLMYSQFCHHYREHVQKKRAVMSLRHKPGDTIEVDWAGQTVPIIDRDTGEVMNASIFVGILPYSQYTFAYAFENQKLESWIEAHIKMYRFFQGVSKILIPDNLKTGVVQLEDRVPTIHPTYQELAEHYGTAIIPTRVRKPQDKPSVERAVRHVSSAILAALRHHKFFHLYELNEELVKRLKKLNDKPFHKKEGSRSSVFLGEEKPFLSPLPTTSYELAEWKLATVQFNYHIQVEKMHYSVPYEYIKHKVDVRITKNTIEIFFQQRRIASHPRLKGRVGQYSTTELHMPEDHQKYLTWNKERFLSWAKTIGPNTLRVTEAILESFRVEQQGYRSCMGLLKLADKYSITRLENACQRILMFTTRPSLKNVKNILVTNQDNIVYEEPKEKPQNKHGFTRGAQYYGGGDPHDA